MEFHVKHGGDVELQDQGWTAVGPGSEWDHTVVFSSSPLPDGVRFEVEVGEVEGLQYMRMGVTTRDPASLPEVPSRAMEVPGSRMVYRGYVYTCGEKPGDSSQTGTYPDNLQVRPGVMVGVSHTGTSVFIHRDGRRLAPIWEENPRPVWAVIQLAGVKRLTVVQPAFMTSVKDIERHLSSETTSDERLYMLREMTTLYHMENQSDHSSQTIRIVCTLLRLALVSLSGELEDFLLSGKVTDMVTDLAKKSGNPTEILRGMTAALQQEDAMHDRFTELGARFIPKWFNSKDALERVLDYCIDKCHNASTLNLRLLLPAVMGGNPNLTPPRIQHWLTELIKINPDHSQEPNYKAAIQSLASNAKYNVKEVINKKEGWTFGHMVAKEGNEQAMYALLDIKTFDVNQEDRRGNSALFHLSKTFEPITVMDIIDLGGFDIYARNRAGENLYEYYMTTEQPDRELAKFISNKMDTTSGKSYVQSLRATSGPEETTKTLQPPSGEATRGQHTITDPPPRRIKQERTVKCVYWRACSKFQDSLEIPDAYFEPKFDYCYCDKCMKSRGDELYYTRGVPRKTYGLPAGWARFGLRPPPQAEALDIFKKWHVGYHGTIPGRLESILHSKDLLMPGDVPFKGKELKPPPGHFTDDSKPAGFDIKQVFVTPSMKYAGHGAYAKVCSWTDPDTKENFEAQVALQVRIEPGSYEVHRETVGAGTELIDEGFSNEELEWSTKQRGAIILTGILVALKV